MNPELETEEMDWLHPTYLWALAAVPVAAGLFLWGAWQRRRALQRFAGRPLIRHLTNAVSTRRRGWKAMAVTGGVLLLALALAGPRYGTRLREVERSGVDLIIALDVSRSMQAEDIAPSRLERAKNEIKDLLDELSGDRVGLVIFAGDAFIQCPLTSDYSTVRRFLDVADPSMLPTPGTDFGAALRKSLDAFESTAPEDREQPRTQAMLFVSDGENHTEGLQSVVERARQARVELYAAGVGETDGSRIPLYRDGRQVGYKKDRAGRFVRTRLEEASLKTLAQNDGYFRVARTSSSLQELAPLLDRLATTSMGTETFEDYAERYQWPLALALLLLFGERLISYRRG